MARALTPLHLAVVEGSWDCIKENLDRGADVNATDALGWTPLMGVCAGGYQGLTAVTHLPAIEYIIDELIDYGAGLNTKQQAGFAAIHLAAFTKNEAALVCLTKSGALANEPEPGGWTPLHFAAAAGHALCAKILLESGAAIPDVRDNQGRTPLSLAAQNGHAAMVTLLLRHGAPPPPPGAPPAGLVFADFVSDQQRAQVMEALARPTPADLCATTFHGWPWETAAIVELASGRPIQRIVRAHRRVGRVRSVEELRWQAYCSGERPVDTSSWAPGEVQLVRDICRLFPLPPARALTMRKGREWLHWARAQGPGLFACIMHDLYERSSVRPKWSWPDCKRGSLAHLETHEELQNLLTDTSLHVLSSAPTPASPKFQLLRDLSTASGWSMQSISGTQLQLPPLTSIGAAPDVVVLDFVRMHLIYIVQLPPPPWGPGPTQEVWPLQRRLLPVVRNRSNIPAEEMTRIVQAFVETCSGTLFSIERVDNPHLQEMFDMLAARIPDHRWMFHGTTSEAIAQIRNRGFLRDLAGRTHGAVYGKGVYFARDAAVSHVYAHPNSSGRRQMIYARVLVGTYLRGTAKCSVENLPDVQGKEVDSLVDNPLDPKIFVVFRDNRAYPSYILTYEDDVIDDS